jgi:hypothetical protein
MDDPRNTAPSWSPAKRVLFRFAFSYLVLYNLPFPLHRIPWAGPILTQPYTGLWNGLVPWVGKHLFGIHVKIPIGGSGDTTYNYVQVLCFLILAAVTTAVWTVLDRKRPEYARLERGLSVYIRFALAATMLSYGAYKVIPSQFALPFPSQWIEPFGEASPMGLLWLFMGASSGYSIFTGAAEMTGGLLLAFRRTALLGALVSIGVLSHVVALNLSYDVPVKLYALHLLAMGVFVTLPYLRRLFDGLVLNRPVLAVAFRPPRARLRRTALVAQAVLVVAYSGSLLYQSYDASHQWGNLSTRPPFYGIWTVEELFVDGVARPPLTTDATRWRRVLFEYPGYLSVQRMDGSESAYGLVLGKRRLTLQSDDKTGRPSFAYRETQPGLLVLAGTMEGRPTRLTLRREDESSYRLVSRGFHWIHETAFNR